MGKSSSDSGLAGVFREQGWWFKVVSGISEEHGVFFWVLSMNDERERE